MNDTTVPQSAASAALASSEPHLRVADTSMLPGSEKSPPAAVKLLNRAVQGAHHALDSLSDRVKPVAWQVGEKVSTTQQALHDKTVQLRHTGDEWAENLRDTVRAKPLTALVVSAAVGVFIARLTHRSSDHR